jgi:hypothetical protein
VGEASQQNTSMRQAKKHSTSATSKPASQSAQAGDKQVNTTKHKHDKQASTSQPNTSMAGKPTQHKMASKQKQSRQA